ncbi:molybdopterin-guanine dinucleotide biosynthesis protein MobA [Actinotalea ferrariae CF5-4]|uniref:Molybdopterin-guanine dinucleotide biosynthesis protein MobA n=1 Tax=Actinotalea ferrariae CF5-4 TaxID=948458 RepID=A0A021VTA3_9CELL|nr:molybdopterin-guanine dinucleotide biosynthesis protein MobA [Actinotalea ferrariae CF5-4]
MYDAIVLAGGRGERLGGFGKAHIPVAGRPLLEHALDAVAAARAVVVVAPPGTAPEGVRSTFEDPPLGGPVAGIAAGLAELPADDDVPVVVLACDVPGAAPAVPLLLEALRADAGADGATVVDAEGRRQTLVAVYRGAALRAAVRRLDTEGGVDGVSVRRLVVDLRTIGVADPAGSPVSRWVRIQSVESTQSTTCAACSPSRTSDSTDGEIIGAPTILTSFCSAHSSDSARPALALSTMKRSKSCGRGARGSASAAAETSQ